VSESALRTEGEYCTALVVAGGVGRRAGADLPKQYQAIGGRSVISLAIRAFLSSPRIAAVQVVIDPLHQKLFMQSTDGLALLPPCAGGATRQASVRLGLEALARRPLNPSHVLIHDAARPGLDAQLLERILNACAAGTAVLPVLPVADTVRAIDGQGRMTLLNRDSLRAAQTPQALPWPAALDLHRRAADQGLEVTDDIALAEWAGLPVALVDGSPDNRKITTADDLDWARGRLADTATTRTPPNGA